MSKTTKNIGKTFIWILMGLLIVGLMGFGATNFSGTLRSIGKVGDTELDINDYARAVQNEINAAQEQAGTPISFPLAQQAGLPDRALAQMVTSAAIENEAKEMGISIGDERLAQDIRAIPQFQGPDGAFNRDAYGFALRNNDLSEQEFEEDVRGDAATSMLQGAVLAGIELPDTYVNTLIAYAGERRSFSWAEVSSSFDLGLPEPTDAELNAWYEANIERFTLPETKEITYVWLTPDMIVDTVEVDEATLRAAYDERFAEFNMPERRLVERLAFADMAAAEAALARVNEGEFTFEALVEERGLALTDVDLGDVSLDDLGAAGEVVFAAETGALAGPVDSDLGPALYRVNAVLAEQVTSFEDAQSMLRDEQALDRARRVIDAEAQALDDELAAGATLEELAQSTEAELGSIGWFNGQDAGIAGYDAFREAAAAITAADFPQIDTLGDGGIFAMRLEEIREAAPQPFEDVRDTVVEGWEQEQKTNALLESAEIAVTALSDGSSFEDQGLTPEQGTELTRNAALPGVPEGMIAKVYGLATGEATTLPGAGTAYVVRLDEILPADMEGESAVMLRQIYGDQAANDIAQDLFRALATDIQTRAGVEINQDARNAVHANFQ